MSDDDLLRLKFTPPESARAYAVAERYAAEGRKAGKPAPKSVMHALLYAAECWAQAVDLSDAWYENERRKALKEPLN